MDRKAQHLGELSKKSAAWEKMAASGVYGKSPAPAHREDTCWGRHCAEGNRA